MKKITTTTLSKKLEKKLIGMGIIYDSRDHRIGDYKPEDDMYEDFVAIQGNYIITVFRCAVLMNEEVRLYDKDTLKLVATQQWYKPEDLMFEGCNRWWSFVCTEEEV